LASISWFDVIISPSNGNGEVEDGQHFGPCLLDEHIADDGRRYRGVTGLSYADDGSHGKK